MMGMYGKKCLPYGTNNNMSAIGIVSSLFNCYVVSGDPLIVVYSSCSANKSTMKLSWMNSLILSIMSSHEEFFRTIFDC